MSPEENLKKLGISLPVPPRPVAAYIPAVRAGNLVFTSGQLPIVDGQLKYTGKVGRDLSQDEGYAAARLCIINALAVLKSVAGDLNRVDRIVKVTGYVNSAEGFTAQPAVINGASELLLEVFEEDGRHARTAVGVPELPLNAAVEVDLIALLR